MDYFQICQEKIRELSQKKSATILAIESSCDETAAAVVKDGRIVLSNVLFSQIDLHKIYGGVVPEIASRSHIEKIEGLVEQALEESGMSLDEMDAIAVTAGPGLIGCLLVGVAFSKSLAFAKKLPLLAVHHIKGHIFANFIAHPLLQPPMMCLVVSGGHTHLVALDEGYRLKIIGKTRDDAAGEAFDKAARVLNLSYPGGPELEKLAKAGDELAFRFSMAFYEGDHYDFSFSGLKTGVINLLHNAEQKGQDINFADVAASFQRTTAEILCKQAKKACLDFGYKTLCMAGGVASNQCIRAYLKEEMEQTGIAFYCPPLSLCTDNAAMIGAAAFDQLLKCEIADLALNARASWPIS